MKRDTAIKLATALQNYGKQEPPATPVNAELPVVNSIGWLEPLREAVERKLTELQIAWTEEPDPEIRTILNARMGSLEWVLKRMRESASTASKSAASIGSEDV